MDTTDSEDYSMSMGKANVASLFLFIPITAICFVLYGMIWGAEGRFSSIYEDMLWVPVLIIGGIILHELIHGVTWMWFSGKPWSAIKFGVNWKALAPYAHSREPMKVSAYRWGAAMPGIVLGVVPMVVSLFTGSAWLAFFGYIFTVTASGDILILWLIRKLDADVWVQDHPERAGCEVVDLESSDM